MTPMEGFFEAAYQVAAFLFPFEWTQNEFMQRALVAIAILMPMSAAMGVQVVNHRMAFFSDAISHSAFTGIAIGVLMSWAPSATMLIFCVVVAVGINRMKRRSPLSLDTVIGVFFSFVVALGIAIISAKRALGRSLPSFLYGDILSLTDSDLAVLLGLAALTATFLLLAENSMLRIAVHPDLARTQGVRVNLIEDLFAACLAMVIAAGIRAVGLLLIGAMLTIPAAAARNVSRSIRASFWIASSVALTSGLAGLCLSYYWDMTTGSLIILVATAFFVLSHIYQWARGS